MRLSGFVAGVVVGAVVGLGFSLLTAPRSGKEMRQQMGEAAASASSSAASGPLTVRDQLTGAVQGQIDRFQEAVAAAQEAAAMTEQEMLREYERVLEDARQTT